MSREGPELWAHNHKGKTFKRPKGKRHYTVIEPVEIYYGFPRGWGIRVTDELGKIQILNWREIRLMEEVT